MDKDYWYVGQKVSDQRYGNGEIISIDKKDSYPIKVKFIDYTITCYTKSGKFIIGDFYPVLSPHPHVPIKYKTIFKKGDLVKYKYQGNWYIGIYGGIEEGSHKVYEGFDDENMTKISSYHYIEDEDILKY